MPEDRPELPVDELRAAVAHNAAARERIDALHRELSSETPAPGAIKEHVAALRKHAPLSALITAWFEDPRTQAFIDELTATGL
jgi:hypothetical protein